MRSTVLLLLSLFISILFLAGCSEDSTTAPPLQQFTTSAWVVNSLSSTLSRVDLDSGDVTVNVLSLGTFANDIAVSGTMAYVVNSGDNQIQIVDLTTGQTDGTIEILLGMNPWAIAVDGSQRGYVTNYLTGNVSVLDLVSRQESDTLVVGTSPEGVCIHQDVLYVTDVNLVWPVYGQGYVHAYSLPDLDHVAVIPVATNPQVVLPGPDGMIHVVCTGDFGAVTGQVQLIDPATHSVVDSIALGEYPGSLAFSQGVGFLGYSRLDGTGAILSYDVFARQVLRGADNPIPVNSGVWDVVATPEGRLLACCFGADQVVELETDGTVVATYDVGNGPQAVGVAELPEE
ncbi:MAG: hypothetical protein C4524_14035 [Candidatus Zixiibacteriota bacterium]|nr:MAG: hypothetical protein C4524_14035 [candidate division Zixibacteria bacterium]